MKQRNSNIEILRIISILMIVLSHYTVHNGVVNNTLNLGFNRLLLEVTTLGNIGVIIFLLITGYFCIEQEKPFKFKKLVFLYLQILFYTVGIYLVFLILKKETFSIKTFIKCILPITFKEYWFMTAYTVLYIFTPFVNKFINSLSKKEHLIYILISLLIFSVLHTISIQDYYGNEIVQFVIFYSIGAYLRKYKDNIFSVKNNNCIILGLIIIIMSLSVIILDLLGMKWKIFGEHSIYLFSRTSILSILFAVSIFSVFIKRKEYNSKFINGISSSVLGVYLITENNLIRSELWVNILKVYKYVNSNYLILHMLCSIFMIFVICIAIEYIRKSTIEKILNIVYDNINKKIINNKLYKKVHYNINKIFLR